MKFKFADSIAKKMYIMIISLLISSCIIFAFALYSSRIIDVAGAISRIEREYTVTFYQALHHFNRVNREKDNACFNNFKNNIQAAMLISTRFSNIKKDLEKYSPDEVARNLDQAIVSIDYRTAQGIVKAMGFMSSNILLQELINLSEQDYKLIKKYDSLCSDYYNSRDQTYKKKLYLEIISIADKFEKISGKFSITTTNLANWVYNVVNKTILIVVLLYIIFISIGSRLIYKGVMGPIDNARNNIQTSSLELQANSEQQLKAVISHTTAITEIGSVMQELVATSNQVADISNSTINISSDTNKAVEQSQHVLQKALSGMDKIKEKVEISAANMIALGEKNQQIGIVLDLINELSQQVTVLSYNATIEAAGAGEKGKRFMAVADRIIKLAERSVQSSKEIKLIIEDIQADSNKTIMSTEDEIKAVEEGILFSQEVHKSLAEISNFTSQVMTSVDEINISLNQQTTGVEQAASEIEGITVLVEESKDASGQVLETSKHLLQMAEELKRV